MLEVVELMGDWGAQEGVSGSHTGPVLLDGWSEESFLLGEVDSGEEAGGYNVSERVLVAN